MLSCIYVQLTMFISHDRAQQTIKNRYPIKQENVIHQHARYNSSLVSNALSDRIFVTTVVERY